MQKQVEELKLKLKEKDTLVRISKFKLNEVNRNIKQGQLNLIHAEKEKENAKNEPLPTLPETHMGNNQ